MTCAAAPSVFDQLSAAGFVGIGGFHANPEDAVPGLPSAGGPAKTVLMIGSAGPSFWQVFQASPEAADGHPDPMDRFTRRNLGRIAADHGLAAIYPFEGPPYHPFQRWAQRCGGFSPSPIGLLTHHVYGPWLGLRGAFVSGERLDLPDDRSADGPCPACAGKPCVVRCPAGALSVETGYNVQRCRDHLAGRPQDSCRAGCAARRACPVGASFAHDPGQGRFHMNGFFGL
ncbi:hypothetical protein [Roseibium aquae]|uniref:hypothetical protein n=1 Tax=Roseibium aquae TaxID=1323746 RepID=UPI00123CAB44|nr:hypothetical protein [Roseibium aquae]